VVRESPLKKTELTNERFIQMEINGNKKRLYRTGDLERQLAKSKMVCFNSSCCALLVFQLFSIRKMTFSSVRVKRKGRFARIGVTSRNGKNRTIGEYGHKNSHHKDLAVKSDPYDGWGSTTVRDTRGKHVKN
jgi:hypothetical protein